MSIPEPPSRSDVPIRIVSVSDSESYLKWATRLLSSLPGVEAHVYLIDSPILPTDEQITHAVAGTAWAGRRIPVVTRTDLARIITDHHADIVLGAATGPIVAQLFLTAHLLEHRPALVSGLPGMGLPASTKGMNYRRLMDAFIAHSFAEVAQYTQVSALTQVPCEIYLARLPMLRSLGIPQLAVAEDVEQPAAAGAHSLPMPDDVPQTLVFAPQAKVPETLADREAIVRALAGFASHHQNSSVVIKMRSRPGEHETHHEQHSYFDILDSLRKQGFDGADLIGLGYGPLDEFLVPGSALVTVSSTAALESFDRGIPTLLISDFGFDRALLNEAFAESGATGTLAEVAAGDIGFPTSAWLAENYFHVDEGRLRHHLSLLATRAREGQLPNRRSAVWKQKRLLIRAELRTIAPTPVVRAYRKLRTLR
ncbi:hypothetical protein SAMN04489751_2922 [Brevibacterium sandarakinum]|uniref:Uncharacterized protein n=1 Tax=Brevibacterium sandarakinum TaxID=629680 RepID=A0A1H1V7J5_BRESA|nr:DUF6716 putative glycosyltransferase [Brevibacterium sandarakinum]SDS80747.1 hypothetical protein SAMN04489751_2922 [Brevibacterium sandarakinum]